MAHKTQFRCNEELVTPRKASLIALVCMVPIILLSVSRTVVGLLSVFRGVSSVQAIAPELTYAFSSLGIAFFLFVFHRDSL
jgi:hypothetical protein